MFDTNKLPIGIIEEQNIDEEKGTVETQNDLVKKLPISEDNSTIVQNLIQKGNADISKNKNLQEMPIVNYNEFDPKTKL